MKVEHKKKKKKKRYRSPFLKVCNAKYEKQKLYINEM